jgi:hypothetical protein
MGGLVASLIRPATKNSPCRKTVIRRREGVDHVGNHYQARSTTLRRHLRHALVVPARTVFGFGEVG